MLGPCAANEPAATTAATHYLVEHWTSANGLPVNGTSRVLVGKAGYLWLATFDGLVRFDGHRFTVFRSGPEYPELPGNRIVQLVQTDDGQLWLRTEGQRLARFDGQHFHAIGLADGLPNGHVTGIQIDDAGTLWVVTRAGIARRGADQRFTTIAGSEGVGRIYQPLVAA
ncbi:MAG: hypothetical protein L0H70_07290, partial [Xanthomonadales bacterium]|nr:hypothetical protein [Xanthomonadales bacterium]